jgi:hypothetical protein
VGTCWEHIGKIGETMGKISNIFNNLLLRPVSSNMASWDIPLKKNGGFGLARLESRAGNQHRKLMDVDGMSTTNDSIGVQCDFKG